MSPYLRRTSMIVGFLLIVSAFRVTRTTCHEVLPAPLAGSSAATEPTGGGFVGSQVREEYCDTDLRLPAAFATAGVGLAAAALVIKPKR